MSEQSLNNLEPQLWVDRYADQLFRYALIRVNKRETAEDLVQETFISGLKQKSSFRAESTEKTWLYTILKNKIIDYYRSNEKKYSGKFYDINDEHGTDRYFHHEGSRTGTWKENQQTIIFNESADNQLLSGEFYTILQNCIERLPDKWATVFRLKNIEELETKTICKELNLSSSNLWVIIHRAKLQMQECMKNNWVNEK